MAQEQVNQNESLPTYEEAVAVPSQANKQNPVSTQSNVTVMNNKSRCFGLKILLQLIGTFSLIALLIYVGLSHVHYVKKKVTKKEVKEEIIDGMSLDELRSYLANQTFPVSIDDRWLLESVEFNVYVPWNTYYSYHQQSSSILRISFDENGIGGFELNNDEQKWLKKILESESKYLNSIITGVKWWGAHVISEDWGYHNISAASPLNPQWLLLFKWEYCKNKDFIPIPDIMEEAAIGAKAECPICFDHFQEGGIVSKVCNATPGHWLCKGCAKMLEAGVPPHKCPLCRVTSGNGSGIKKKWRAKIVADE